MGDWQEQEAIARTISTFREEQQEERTLLVPQPRKEP
jgi:hypothetical protein